MNKPFIETVVTRKLVASPFSNSLISARAKHDWHQIDLANKLSTSRTTIANWETGFSVPTLRVFVEMCELFNLTPNELLGWEEK